FLTTASPAAAELAAHVAVSVPSLPVMRLIQHRVLGRSGPGQLAEVLLSGLLRPAGGVRCELVPGAREALLDTLPRPEAQHTRHVLEAVSAEIERRAGTAAETFIGGEGDRAAFGGQECARAAAVQARGARTRRAGPSEASAHHPGGGRVAVPVLGNVTAVQRQGAAGKLHSARFLAYSATVQTRCCPR